MTLQSRFHHPDVRKYVDKYKSADAQKNKLPGRGSGVLPERDLVGGELIKLQKNNFNVIVFLWCLSNLNGVSIICA